MRVYLTIKVFYRWKGFSATGKPFAYKKYPFVVLLKALWLITLGFLTIHQLLVYKNRSTNCVCSGNKCHLHAAVASRRFSFVFVIHSVYSEDCRLVSDSTRRSLRSADVSTCVVPPTLSSYGDRTFAAAGPRLWNSLPVQLHNPDTDFGLFRRRLKGHLFREA